VGLAVVILAAGQGTRMKSALPKMLHEAAGRPLLEHVLRAARPLKPERLVVVIGHGADQYREKYPQATDPQADFTFVYQERRLGTGHALMQARETLKGKADEIMVLNGDGPLLHAETLKALLARQRRSGSGMTMLTCRVDNPGGLGRIVRAQDGSVEAIVEEKDATAEQKSIKEINPGVFVFDREVFALAERLSSENAAGEYYITDLVGLYLEEAKPVQAVLAKDASEVLAVNDRAQLAHVERLLRERICRRWLSEGVTMISPEQTFIDDTVVIEPDVVLYPGVFLRGQTVIRRGAVVGPYAVLDSCVVEAGVQVKAFTALKNQHLST
jgi:UDP-N-acetylglucosamine diphosphorylase/glucosamine-1-phosphate N-acetyltransferase